ncbi:hypothetical protein EBE87_03300 [Pseudoroseomonas wenyumeiae]|uniref:Uncharacterized protein n=1 Tax=Teichococcus wenyumeiae TaxID=2478470 RepID=A0A3A9J856_9PROT|nr:hypothetical protein [Pseudoroseomonas wenyumeiae]RKK02170.1 hypothetical protein D6Z83_21135 [Pseudoroseomonas wenyumeiae]RMI26327.1 hypothetical protein EBE87_03300 [Pseudoroseomonas wenyumeiae]
MPPRLFLLLPLLASLPGTAAAEALRTVPQDVSYCRELAARLAPLPGAEKEPARSLAEEGVRLCDDGYVRTGVAKLRRALKAAQGR